MWDPHPMRRGVIMLDDKKMTEQIESIEAMGTAQAQTRARVLRMVQNVERKSRQRRSSMDSYAIDSTSSDAAPEMIREVVSELKSVQADLAQQLEEHHDGRSL